MIAEEREAGGEPAGDEDAVVVQGGALAAVVVGAELDRAGVAPEVRANRRGVDHAAGVADAEEHGIGAGG